MSAASQKAHRIIESSTDPGGPVRPHDYDLRVAATLAAVAQAEALERIGDLLQNFLDRGVMHP